MYSVSQSYKKAMNANIRNRAYMTVSLGVVNNEAQNNAKLSGDFEVFSNQSIPFTSRDVTCQYATLEQNLSKADGSLTFLPENEETAQYQTNRPAVTNDILGSVTIILGGKYAIKGLTIDFGDYYPTKLKIVTDNDEYEYSNTDGEFVATTAFGEITYLTIVPISMVGGEQRLRINRIVLGVGITFTNDNISSATHTEYVNAISEELPSTQFNLNALDYEGKFDVDNKNSYVNYLETGQTLNYSIGMELDDGSIEYIPISSLFLSDWSSKHGSVTFTATDRLAFMDGTYADGNTIHERTLYQDAIDVLTAAGLEPDEYSVDECLKDIAIVNPLPEASYAECLQLIANAGRCKLFQNRSGLICIQANFENVINPDDYTLSSSGTAAWSKPENIIKGTDIIYADMTNNVFSADGSMFFMPVDENYLETSFVSAEVADNDGLFKENPNFSIELPAAYIYYSVYMKFDGNPPQEIVIKTYKYGELQETCTVSELEKENWISHEFKSFDKMYFEVTKASPNDRVMVNMVSFGDITDYTLRHDDMYEYPDCYQEKKTKSVSVKVYSFENKETEDDDGNKVVRPQVIDDYNYETYDVNTSGESVTFENQLISTAEHAQMVAEWLGSYYKENVSYNINYRGEPRLNASDRIYMESDAVNGLQINIETLTLGFNGAFSGTISARRAFTNVQE